MEKECCGSCVFHRYSKGEGDFICTCEDSDAYCVSTAYSDSCMDWSEKD